MEGEPVDVRQIESCCVPVSADLLFVRSVVRNFDCCPTWRKRHL